jgi:hypothetical protein
MPIILFHQHLCSVRWHRLRVVYDQFTKYWRNWNIAIFWPPLVNTRNLLVHWKHYSKTVWQFVNRYYGRLHYTISEIFDIKHRKSTNLFFYGVLQKFSSYKTAELTNNMLKMHYLWQKRNRNNESGLQSLQLLSYQLSLAPIAQNPNPHNMEVNSRTTTHPFSKSNTHIEN